MSLTVYNPFRLVESGLLRDPFFRDFFREAASPEAARASQGASVLLVPRMNVSEKDGAYDILVEVPGLSKDEIHVEVENNRLAVWGEKKVEKSEVDKEKKFHVREISVGSFRREVALPDDVDEAKIEASYDHGHLKLHVPKAVPQKTTRRIAIG